MGDRLTILIAARNAETTIERALHSCIDEPGCRVLLVNDHSTDSTVDRARALAGSRLRVLDAPDPGGIPVARQCGLDHVDTELAAWLDADDEWIPGRAERLMTALDSGADVAVDAFDLHDGATGRWLRRLAVPEFLSRPGGEVRLFERNWLPGDTPVGFRVSTFRSAGGYDPAVYGPESYDLLLRAIARGARFTWSNVVGYRVFAYAGSVSRNRLRQRAAVAAALKKHDDATVRHLYEQAGYSPRVAAWALVSVALFRGEPDAALRFLDEASPDDTVVDEILEPDGPWPVLERWRREFTRGVCLLLLGGRDREAIRALMKAETLDPTAEGANNLGVALARLGRDAEARVWWTIAGQRFPGYVDALSNRRAPQADQITTHPLRRFASRRDYAA